MLYDAEVYNHPSIVRILEAEKMIDMIVMNIRVKVHFNWIVKSKIVTCLVMIKEEELLEK